MSDQFTDQGGVATSNPGSFYRWLTSKMMTRMSSERHLLAQRKKNEKQLRKKNAAYQVEYFHQLDDPYSHLAAQLLRPLQERYDIELLCHLVSVATDKNTPEPEMLARLAEQDAAAIAPYYGLSFPDKFTHPEINRLQNAQKRLAEISTPEFLRQAVHAVSIEELERQGNQRRAKLKHYAGAMFYFAGEWYWGIDRLHHLQERLKMLGLDRHENQPPLAPLPPVITGSAKDDGQLHLQIFASLRSPYTAVIFDYTVRFAKQMGINLQLRPVLPMVMRGVPATREKGMYILQDAGREARIRGLPFGPCYDPIGQPALNGYAIYYWADAQGKGVEFFSNFLRAAWTEQINLNKEKNLRELVQRSGLGWPGAKQAMCDTNWLSRLEENRLAMYADGLWGVPCFRLFNQQGEKVLSVWGQDRLWLVAEKIQKLLKR